MEERADLTGVPVTVPVVPPTEVRTKIENEERPCGSGRFDIVWARGPKAGLPVQLYCAEPLCLDQDPPACTGPRFVPALVQYTSLDENDPFRRPREMDTVEVISSVRVAGEMARKQTGRPDERSDLEVARHVGRLWTRAKLAYKGLR